MTTFADLHRPGDPFVLPNAWDVGSARALADAGFLAVGTTSLGIAASHGLPDATGAARDATLDAVRSLVAVLLPCFVTADLEDGFSSDPEAVAELVAGLGVAGVNLEDATAGALVDPAVHARRIAAVKQRCPEVFVNARTDVFWLGIGALRDALDRLRLYRDAGADGVFVPGDLSLETIEVLVGGVDAPLNVLASGRFTLGQLGEAGAARVSTGSMPYRVALTRAVEAAETIRDGGVAPAAWGYERVQALHSP